MADQNYPGYIVGFMLENHPEKLMYYIERGMQFFPLDNSYAQMVVSVAHHTIASRGQSCPGENQRTSAIRILSIHPGSGCTSPGRYACKN
jgi:hypothetical protein